MTTFFAVMAAACLYVVVVVVAMNADNQPPAPTVRSINYETMTDCVAEQSYELQYSISMQQLEDMLRACGTFASTPIEP